MDLIKILDRIKEMEWVDLSHEFDEETPRWPGFEPLKKEIKLNFDAYPVRTYLYTFPGQYGTHIDVPAHADAKGRTLEQITIKECVMPLCVIDCSKKVLKNKDYELTIKDIDEYEQKFGIIPEKSFVAMRSDWSYRWPNQKKFLNEDENGIAHYPGWSIEAVRFLIENRDVASFGHETFDTDPPASFRQRDFQAECFILNSDRFQIEMMNNLDKVPEKGAIIVVLFPKQTGGTGFPARCFAIYSKEM